MPVIKHYDGVCHVYVDREADLKMATAILINGKCQRPGVCNAVETLLVHRDVVEDFLSLAAPDLQSKSRNPRGFRSVPDSLPTGIPDFQRGRRGFLADRIP